MSHFVTSFVTTLIALSTASISAAFALSDYAEIGHQNLEHSSAPRQLTTDTNSFSKGWSDSGEPWYEKLELLNQHEDIDSARQDRTDETLNQLVDQPDQAAHSELFYDEDRINLRKLRRENLNK
ncbi:hypothetical protein [Sphaerothrix gracilis]|uniref:hypothetical protein n=1 Tax=Sphaerothrix gracilis TaxID=3151835 RepID=UPI0031FBED6C